MSLHVSDWIFDTFINAVTMLLFFQQYNILIMGWGYCFSLQSAGVFHLLCCLLGSDLCWLVRTHSHTQKTQNSHCFQTSQATGLLLMENGTQTPSHYSPGTHLWTHTHSLTERGFYSLLLNRRLHRNTNGLTIVFLKYPVFPLIFRICRN